MYRGWFPIAAVTPLIDAGAPPVYSPVILFKLKINKYKTLKIIIFRKKVTC